MTFIETGRVPRLGCPGTACERTGPSATWHRGAASCAWADGQTETDGYSHPRVDRILSLCEQMDTAILE